MKILVTGVKGQLGYDVVQEGEGRGLEMFVPPVLSSPVFIPSKFLHFFQKRRFQV